jgi:hypothetical protein
MSAVLSPIAEALLLPLVDGRKELALRDEELMGLAEKAQQFAGNKELATELLAVAKKLHDAGAETARDQAVIVAAVVLEDMELNGALCRRLYKGKRAMGDVTGHPSLERTARKDLDATDPNKNVLAARLRSLTGVKREE